MSHFISGSSAVWSDTLRILDAGDALTSASLYQSSSRGAIGVLADRTAFLKDRHTGWISVPLTTPIVNEGNRWAYITGALEFRGWRQEDVSGDSGGFLTFGVSGLPASGTVLKMRVGVTGQTVGSHAALPANRMNYQLVIMDPPSGSLDDAVDALDQASGSAAEYDSTHFNEYNIVSLPKLGSDKSFYFQVIGENGANSVAGTFTVQTLHFLVTDV